MAKPLRALQQKGVTFIWSEESGSFEEDQGLDQRQPQAGTLRPKSRDFPEQRCLRSGNRSSAILEAEWQGSGRSL